MSDLRNWSGHQGVEVVLPMTERACFLCNAERAAWESAGIIVGAAPAAVLMRAFDKAETVAAAMRCGVNMPATRVPTSMAQSIEFGEELGYPCVVKGRFSDAWDGKRFLTSSGTRYVSSKSELEEAVVACKQGDFWPLIQKIVSGQGKGVFTLCDRGRALAWFAHERLRDVRPTGSGSSLRRSIPLQPRLRRVAEQLLAEMEWHGPAMVEFCDTGEESPCVMEVNGRFWTSLQLAIDAGVNFPQLWVSALLGETLQPTDQYESGLILRWVWGDFKRLLYILSGRPAGYQGPYPTVWQGIKEIVGGQPVGTRVETWDRRDPFPGIGEWFQGISELAGRVCKS
jgi:hypothetical protein